MFGLDKVFSSISKSTAKPETRSVGIDFGSSSIKVVELEKRERALTLVSYGELQLGPYLKTDMGKPVDLEPKTQTEALVDVLRESQIKTKNGVLSLPLVSSFVTVMSLTAKPDEDLAPRVRVEARKYIPVPMTDVSLDWTELQSFGTVETSTRDVLIAAIQNTSLQQMNQLLQVIEMKSQSPEIELFSTIRAASPTAGGSVAVIDLGAETAKLYIAKDGVIHRLHRVHAGGTNVTEKISQLVSVPYEEAENKKRNFSPAVAHAVEIKKAYITSYERTMQEFRRVIEQYELRDGVPVGAIMFTGGSAMFPELKPFAKYIFDREVTLCNGFKKVAYPAFMQDVMEDISPIFTVALGAALRPFEGQ